jgi:hypothetical protein
MNVEDNSEIIFKEWFRKLSYISSEEWELFKWSDIEEKRIIYRGFWREREWEIDDKQPRDGRFALKDVPVSWWAQDFSIAQSEHIPGIREKKRRILEDSIRIEPDKWQYVDHCFLNADTVLLDLRIEISPFYLSLKKHKLIESAQSFITNCISSEEEGCKETVYPITHAIAESAYINGFKAISWKSARQYSDTGSRHCCVAIFDEETLRTEMDPELKKYFWKKELIETKTLLNCWDEYERNKFDLNSSRKNKK